MRYKVQFVLRGRAIVNVRWIVGGGGVIPMVTLHKNILLKRELSDPNIVTELDANGTIQYMIANNFCTPTNL